MFYFCVMQEGQKHKKQARGLLLVHNTGKKCNMKTSSNHWTDSSGTTGRRNTGSGSLSKPYHDPEGFSLVKAIRRFFLGIQQIWVAIRYYFFFRHAQLVRFQQKTWVRLTVLALVFLYVFGREGTGFSTNGLFSGPGTGEERMGMAQPVTLLEEDAFFRSAGIRQLDDQKVRQYIKRFNKIARLESQRYGIPASVLLAQAISESWAGDHPAARESNNHFGRIFSDKSYSSAWENWRAHSIWMSRKYPEMLRQNKDYEGWAKVLQQSGYSLQRRYAKTLVGIIEKYHLYTLDE